MAEADNEQGVISTEMAAKLLMISVARVGQIEKMEYIKKVGRNRWNLVNLVQGYINFLRDEDRRSSKSAGASRIQSIKADQLEMDIAAKRRELVAIDDVRLVLDGAAGLMRTEMMAVPARFTRDIAERKRLDTLMAEAMNTVADGMDEKAAKIAAGDALD